VLGYDDTLQQTLSILFNLKVNDNPEFPADGIYPSLVIGQTFKAIALPSVIRQLFQVCSTDDIISKIEVLDTSFDQDSLNLKTSISIKSGESKQMTLVV
jgi:hypothetical protein